MSRVLPVLDAKRLAARNAADLDDLSSTTRAMATLGERHRAMLEKACVQAFDGVVVPFAMLVGRLRGISLDTLALLDSVPELGAIDAASRTRSVQELQSLVTVFDSLAAGRVSQDAVYAELGSRSFASEEAVVHGVASLASVGALPLLMSGFGLAPWQGLRALREQRRLADDISAAADLQGLDLERVTTLVAHFTDMRHVLRALSAQGELRLTELAELLEVNDDWTTFDADERELVSQVTALVVALATLLRCPIVAVDGTITELSTTTLDTANRVAFRLAA